MIKNQNDSSSEISLTSIKNSVTDVSLALFAFFSGFSGFLLKYKFIILITTCLGFGFGYLATTIPQKKYTLRLIVNHTDLTKKTYAEMLEQLQNLIQSGSREELASRLKIEAPLATKIASIEAIDMNGEPLLRDTTTTTIAPFIIEASVYDNTISDTLQQRLLEFFNNNPFLKQRKNVQKNVYELKVLFIDSELRKLDSLKQQYNQFLGASKSNAMFYNNAFNPAEIYEQSNEYQNQRDLLVRWLAQDYESLRLIQGFETVSKPFTFGGKLKIIIKFSIIGFAIGCCIGIAWELTIISKMAKGE
jgi:hypothetical protein